MSAPRLAAAALRRSALKDHYAADFPDRLGGARPDAVDGDREVATWIEAAEEVAEMPLITDEDVYFALVFVSPAFAKEFADERPQSVAFERHSDAFTDRLGHAAKERWDLGAAGAPTPRDRVRLPVMGRALDLGEAEFSLLSEARCYLQSKFESDPVANATYRRFHLPIHQAFEARHGPIAEEYWCTRAPIGVVRTSGGSSRAQVHFDGDYDERFIELFNRCKEINRKSREFLPQAEHETMAGNLYGLLTDFLATVDRTAAAANADGDWAPRVRLKPFLDRVKGLEAELDAGSGRQGQRWYIAGTVVGLVAIGAVLAFAAALADGNWTRIFEGAIFGAAGALASVLYRMNRGALKVDAQQGKRLVYTGALVKPLAGAVFGGIVVALLLSGLLPIEVPEADPQRFYFLGVLAFVAGFSERWAPNLLQLTAERVSGEAKAAAPAPG